MNHRIVAGLRRLEPANDFQTAMHAGLEGMGDPAVLVDCAEAARILVTHDWKTMPDTFAAHVEQRSSPGVIIVPRAMRIHHAVQELYLAWSASTMEDWVNALRRAPW